MVGARTRGLMNITINKYLKENEEKLIPKYKSNYKGKKKYGLMYEYKNWFGGGTTITYDWYKTKTARDEAFGKSYKFKGQPIKVER